MNKCVLTFAIIAICGTLAYPSGPPGGCNTDEILPGGKHQTKGDGDGGFKLCLSSAGGSGYTITIDQTSAPFKINGLRLRPDNSPGSFMQDFEDFASFLGDIHGGDQCIHHKAKLETVLPDQTSFTYLSASGGRPTIDYYIVAGPSANFWNGTIVDC